jgi:hypothetical protein
MDTRYLISNSKDQSIKLWDMRRFADEATIERSRRVVDAMNRIWDYRIGFRRTQSRIHLTSTLYSHFKHSEKETHRR